MIRRTLNENLSAVRSLGVVPRRALEVGALPGHMGVLSHFDQIPERLGINLNLEGRAGGVQVCRGDARDLPWPDHHFDLVVCASTLEHIPDFWVAVSEMKRVLAPGGTLLLSTPGYATLRGERPVHGLAKLMHLPDLFVRGTFTMRVHDQVDYYRFSEAAFRDVLMAGLHDVRVWRIMNPPRIYATGRKGRHAETTGG